LTRKIVGLGIGIGVSILAAVATFALGFYCPLFWIGTAISVVSTIGCSAALYDLKSQRNGKRFLL